MSAVCLSGYRCNHAKSQVVLNVVVHPQEMTAENAPKIPGKYIPCFRCVCGADQNIEPRISLGMSLYK